MKKNFFKFSSLCLILSFLSNVFAGTIFVVPGAEATGMGGAFTAVADDVTSIYYNPAGLTNLDKSGVEASCFFMDAKAKISNPVIIDGTLLYPNNISIFENGSKNLDIKANIPFFAGYTKIKDFHLAFGVYGVGGGTGKWEGLDLDVFFEKMQIKNEYSFLIYNVSGAKKINEKLSLGIGLNILQMEDETDIYQEYHPNYRKEKSSINKKSDGVGYEGVIGAMYKPIEKFKLGFTFKTGCNIKLKGDAEYTYENKYNEEALQIYNINLQKKVSYERDYKYPLSCSIGASYDITEKFLLALSFDLANFSRIRTNNYTYDEEYSFYGNSVFEDDEGDKIYKNTCVISLGSKYKLKENLDLLFGIRRDPSLYRRKDNVNFFNTEQYALTVFTLGASYKYKSMKFAGSIVYNISDKLMDNYGNSYEFDSVVYRGTIGYNF